MRRNNLSFVDEESPCSRRWEDMDHEILIYIMKRYSWLPSLKSFVSPEKITEVSKQYSFSTHTHETQQRNGMIVASCMGLFMQSLGSVCCYHISMVIPFARYCKSIRSLTVFGRMCGNVLLDKYAEYIAEGFPLLEHLTVSLFVFSVKGLSMILDGHEKLQSLDLQHTVCCDERDTKVRRCMTPIKSPWPEEISKRIAKVKTLLTCAGKNCARCRHYYQPSL